MEPNTFIVEDSKTDRIFNELKNYRWTVATPFITVVNKTLGTNLKLNSDKDRSLMDILDTLDKRFPAPVRNQMLLFYLNLPNRLELVPPYEIALALTFWKPVFTRKIMDWLDNLPGSIHEGDHVYLSGATSANSRKLAEKKVNEIGNKLKKLNITLVNLENPGLTHIALGFHPSDAIPVLKASPNIKITGIGKLLKIAAKKENIDESTRFLKVEESKGGTELMDNLLQLLDSKDKNSVKLAMEMIKTGGATRALLEQLLLIAKTNSNTEIRRWAREILLKDAPPEWKLMISNPTVFELMEARKNKEIKRKLDEMKVVAGEPVEVLRALFIKNFSLGGEEKTKTKVKAKPEKLQPVTINNGMNEIEAVAWWNSLSEPFIKALSKRGYKQPSQVNEILSLTDLELWFFNTVDISPITALKNLTDVNLTCHQQIDLAPLGKLKNLNTLYLYIGNLTKGSLAFDLSGFKELTSLPKLTLKLINTINSAPLQYLTNLTSFTLEFREEFDLKPLQYCKKLKTLNLYENAMTDLTGLQLLTSVTSLDLRHNNITNLAPIQSLTNLTKLKLGFNRKLSDISPLACLVNLKELELSNNEISDITPLIALVNLKELNLISYRGNDITPLQKLIQLTRLNLESSALTDIAPVGYLVNLTILRLYCKTGNIGPLKRLIKLRKLNILNNGITDLTPLRDLVEMRDLDIGFNNINDLIPLRNMVKLKTLKAFHNKITDFLVLALLPELETIDLSSNKITDASPIRQMPKLEKIDLENNPVDTAPYETIIGKVRSLMNLFPEKRL